MKTHQDYISDIESSNPKFSFNVEWSDANKPQEENFQDINKAVAFYRSLSYKQVSPTFCYQIVTNLPSNSLRRRLALDFVQLENSTNRQEIAQTIFDEMIVKIADEWAERDYQTFRSHAP